MPHPFTLRTLVALGVAVVAIVAGTMFGGGVEGVTVMLVGTVAAVLTAAGTGESDAPPPAPAPEPLAPPPDVRELLEAIGEPILLIEEGRVAQANSGARALLGGHIIGQDARLAIRHPAAAEALTAAALPDRGAPDPVSLVGLGTIDQRWEMRLTALSDGRRVVHLIDQTARDAAERMRVDFVANASHELRTPLASILGFVETLSDDKAGADPQVRARFLNVLLGEARRMQRLVEDLISLSRIEADKYRLPATPVDLALLIEEVHAELADGRDPRTENLIGEIDAGVPAVAGDRAQLSQLLHNLVGNAMKYGRAGTPVVTRLWRDTTGMVRITVADEGEGIPPEHLPRLTERFYRVDAGRSRGLGGTGLGLSIVKHIVERHRGRLDLHSVVGKGTTASIALPPIANPSAPEAASSKGNINVTKARASG
ncbi:MAG: ATPase [Proteobacteria bacterium SG_bin6]|nr:MAG: ATPase [Proteobacteria bacterium SG_bin6]